MITRVDWLSRRGLIGLGVAAILAVAACDSDPDAQFEQQENEQNTDAGETNAADSDANDANDADPANADRANARGGGGGETDEPPVPPVTLAVDGEAKMPIVVGEHADEAVQEAADELADYLGEISDADFEVVEDDGANGIVVGTLEDFELAPLEDVEFDDGPFDREDYVLRSEEDQGLFLLGASPMAVRFAVWDLLYRFGHRQFFPPETWEVVPEHDTLEIGVDVHEQPDYHNRQAPRGALRMRHRPWAEEHWENWQLRNRTTPTFSLETGHAYENVIAAHEDEFAANPDYWGLVDGERTSDAQPNVANEDVQQLFIDHALGRLDSEPDLQSVPMDPRDGNEWSESAESLQIGGPSEQAVFLANRVAEEIVEEHGDEKFVGMYGYSHHSPPPDIDAHPNVIVSLATSYIRGGYTFEEMIDGWSERTEMIGIREYYGLWVWDNSLPGNGASAADTEYLRETIPHFHQRGARFMNAESNDTWGGYGLGYYLASRMLWDVEEAERIDELIDDFLHKAFGPAKEPMAQFYALIDGSAADPYAPEQPRRLNDDMVGRMYRLLDEARDLAADDQRVRKRIDDLILYTHYVELYRRYDAADDAERQEAFDELVSFAWRIRDTMMTESLELVQDINRDVRVDDDLQWGQGHESGIRPADRHRQDEDEPFTDADIEQFLQEGIANHDLVEFDLEPWEDSAVLEPAGFAPDERGEPETRTSRGAVEAALYTDNGTLPELTISAGYIYDDRGPLMWSLKTEDGELVDEGEVAPDEEDHHFELQAPEPGVYRLSIENTGQGFVWDYEPRGAHLTLLAGGEYRLRGNWFDGPLYFYVPLGTEDIYLAGTLLEGRHEFVDGDGMVIDPDSIEETQGYTRVPVPQGQDGRLWALDVNTLRPEITFLNIPGYLALSPDELLLPEEVVDEL